MTQENKRPREYRGYDFDILCETRAITPASTWSLYIDKCLFKSGYCSKQEAIDEAVHLIAASRKACAEWQINRLLPVRTASSVGIVIPAARADVTNPENIMAKSEDRNIDNFVEAAQDAWVQNKASNYTAMWQDKAYQKWCRRVKLSTDYSNFELLAEYYGL